MITIITTSILCSSYNKAIATQKPKKAVCITPIADLIGYSMKNAKKYEELPYDGKPIICPRLHQLLFNEVVEIIAESGQEVKIRTPQTFFITHANKKPHTTYWTLKSNLIDFETLKKKGINTTTIPQPIDFHAPNHNLSDKNIITLTAPFYDKTTKQTFSAGTRFKKVKKGNKRSVPVYMYDQKTESIKTIRIPQSICFNNTAQTKEEKIKTFVQTVQKWANIDDFIPYVFGGSSFTSTKKGNFTKKQKKIKGANISFFMWEQEQIKAKAGLDCSGLILRGAQLCGIPYFFKNTTTLAHYLSPIGKTEKISAGDLICISGHVIIVSDVEKNLLVEARAYSPGYGKVHEIELNKVFKGIRSYHDLRKAYFDKKTLYRLDKNGNVTDKFPQFKLLKMASVWEVNNRTLH